MSNYETNPVGALQERFQSRGVTPQYKTVQVEGASHALTFALQVTLGDLTANGTGSSKKIAKHKAAQAMLDQLDKLDGRKPDRDRSEDRVRKVRGRENEDDSVLLRTLWVGNLHSNVDEQILYELFLNSGPLEKVTIPKDRETMKQKSFGFVVFEHEESVQYAKQQMEDVKLFGHHIILRRAIKKEKVSDSISNVKTIRNVQTSNSLGSGPAEAANNSCFAENKIIDLKESDDKYIRNPQAPILRNGIKLNLIKSGKSKVVPELKD